MTEIARIRDQLKRSVEGEAWHGPALAELLREVTAEQAAQRPLKGGHSIWEIVLHLTGTANEILGRLDGIGRTEIPPEDDWPSQPDRPDESEWQAAVSRIRELHNQLDRRLSQLDDARMDTPIEEGFSTVYMTLHGHIQHNLYHAGQIALLRKMF
ncbi:MAG: DinB family protein [Candidatus Zixiibacteriota bacterium]|nr:MAG: DinB family protein [candidate division Zixibacteria bacterium]